ncbi:MAG: glutamine--fructose-6-phosphate aminotransferase, partial [Gemmatimonadota bacterium]|nr:glutamine--fructose-6-phosphate aminotransferase [Gemmatimonadota bacterium]
MCGIVGYVGPKEAAPILLQGLKRLEYRGYDSAGLALLNGSGVQVVKRQGKLSELNQAVAEHSLRGSLTGTCGIAHTRW